jgi:hypothetical protein
MPAIGIARQHHPYLPTRSCPRRTGSWGAWWFGGACCGKLAPLAMALLKRRRARQRTPCRERTKGVRDGLPATRCLACCRPVKVGNWGRAPSRGHNLPRAHRVDGTSAAGQRFDSSTVRTRPGMQRTAAVGSDRGPVSPKEALVPLQTWRQEPTWETPTIVS